MGTKEDADQLDAAFEQWRQAKRKGDRTTMNSSLATVREIGIRNPDAVQEHADRLIARVEEKARANGCLEELRGKAADMVESARERSAQESPFRMRFH
jgi:hypothetical protein